MRGCGRPSSSWPCPHRPANKSTGASNTATVEGRAPDEPQRPAQLHTSPHPPPAGCTFVTQAFWEEQKRQTWPVWALPPCSHSAVRGVTIPPAPPLNPLLYSHQYLPISHQQRAVHTCMHKAAHVGCTHPCAHVHKHSGGALNPLCFNPREPTRPSAD